MLPVNQGFLVFADLSLNLHEFQMGSAQFCTSIVCATPPAAAGKTGNNNIIELWYFFQRTEEINFSFGKFLHPGPKLCVHLVGGDRLSMKECQLPPLVIPFLSCVFNHCCQPKNGDKKYKYKYKYKHKYNYMAHIHGTRGTNANTLQFSGDRVSMEECWFSIQCCRPVTGVGSWW